MQQWIARDKAVNWHPYSQMKKSNHIPIVRGEGSYIFDGNGKGYLDMICSWWVTLHGHAHPYIATKVFEQLNTLEQVIFAGFTHEPAVVLSERLLALLPANQEKVFYTDNGSTAVEVALKMCIQQSYQRGNRKSKIVAFRNGYHGDTFGAMSVSARGQWTAPFADMLFDVLFIDAPTPENLQASIAVLREHAEEIACFIYEPLVQGAGGMLMHRAEDLSVLMRACRQLGITMIQDEVFVGFGRTGTLFAADQLTEMPDIMCFSKGLTGGTMPMGITTCTEAIYQSFYDDDKRKALFHGHSFTASPIACAASLASLDLLLCPETRASIKRIVDSQAQFARQLQDYPKAKHVRQMGTILAFDWAVEDGNGYFSDIQQRLSKFFMERGVLLRPLGNVVYILPPYCATTEQLQKTYEVLIEALKREWL